MTFNDNARVGGSRARRRGTTTAIVGGGVVGVGAIVVLLLNLFTGQDFSALLGGGMGAPAGSSQSSGESEIAECETGADANARIDCRLAAATFALDQYWEGQLDGYREPGVIIVDGSTSSPCGTASNATGPFYCPADETVYMEPTFFGVMRERFGATAESLSQLYVLAHEYGHHIQSITGLMQQHPPGDSGPASNGVRIELQADCFAGAWIAAMTEQVDEAGTPFLKAPTDEQIQDALNAAATVGDDHIQQTATGQVHPETWTHGSSEQRQRWFARGYQAGLGSCDTFGIDGNQL